MPENYRAFSPVKNARSLLLLYRNCLCRGQKYPFFIKRKKKIYSIIIAFQINYPIDFSIENIQNFNITFILIILPRYPIVELQLENKTKYDKYRNFYPGNFNIPLNFSKIPL